MLKEKIDSNYLYQKQYLNNLKRNIVLEKIKIIFYKYHITLETLNQYKKHTGKKNVKELNMFSKYLTLKIEDCYTDDVDARYADDDNKELKHMVGKYNEWIK